MDDATWTLIETERRTLADLLEPLTPEQWATPSLCSEWRVRDVAAHLAMTPAGCAGTPRPGRGPGSSRRRTSCWTYVGGPGVEVIRSRSTERRHPQPEEGARP